MEHSDCNLGIDFSILRSGINAVGPYREVLRSKRDCQNATNRAQRRHSNTRNISFDG